MKKKILSYLMVLLTGVMLLSADEIAKNNKIIVWSFTDELSDMINNYFKSDSRFSGKYEIDYSAIRTYMFPDRLDSVLASGSGCPDVFSLEDAFVRKYVESGQLLDLTDVYNEVKDKLVNYPVEVGTYKGRVYALSWQVAPGALFYRRSLAKKYLGTDDPEVVQKYFNSWDDFLKTAEILKSKSSGKCYVVSSTDDLFLPYKESRTEPWVVDGKLVVDSKAVEYMEMCKTLKKHGLEGCVAKWSAGWIYGMNGRFCDKYGNKKEVFSYFLPSWGIKYVLKSNAPDTFGDWAMIQGPAPYYWGGTWVGAWAKTKNPNAVKTFIKYLMTDDALLEAWAKNTGDVVSNTKVQDKVCNMFLELFLNGQNHYAEFSEISRKINGKLSQATDSAIEELFDEAKDAYVNGEKTMDEALNDFKKQVNDKILIGN